MLTLPGYVGWNGPLLATDAPEYTAIKMMFHFQFTQDINSFMPPICFLYMEFMLHPIRHNMETV